MIKDENFFTVSGWMLNKLQLKGNELMIYAIIYGFSQGDNIFNGSLQYLADWTNSTRRGVMKNLDSLLGKGLISREPAIINGRKGYNYHVNKIIGEQSSQVNKVHVTVEQSSRYSGTKFTDTGEQSSPNNNINTNRDKNNKINADSKSALVSEFDTLWKIYPRKVGKSNALTAYIKARTDKDNPVSFDTVKTGIERYKEQIKAEETPTKFIKHGSTWFNQRCWQDNYNNSHNDESLDDMFRIVKEEDNRFGGKTKYFADGYIRVFDGYDLMIEEIKPKQGD